ncbi:MAG: helix-turn-helix transcriptional regulator [Halieaceae bacterium]|jgi:AraC family transcriptional regulator|nr:helix-turn-helix transcriptional regulator [Halieaceae bacterium]
MPSIENAPSQVLYSDEMVTIGHFAVTPTHPQFRLAGAITNPTIVFPRIAVEIQHLNRDPFSVDQNCISLYNKGQQYERTALVAEGDSCDWFEFNPNALAKLPDIENHRAPFEVARVEGSIQHYLLQRKMIKSLQAASIDVNLLQAQVILLLAESLRGVRIASAAKGYSQEQQSLVEKTRHYLALRFRENGLVEDIASAMGVSAFHLCRVFKGITSKSMHQYRIELRLRHALAMVESTKDLSRVALELGYSSHSHFSTSFKNVFGNTPKQVRQQLLRN